MDEQNEPHLPKLQSALRGLAREQLFVPSATDQKILAEVRKHFGEKETETSISEVQLDASDVLFRSKRAPSKLPRRLNPWQRWLPLAASIVIAATMFYFASTGRTLAADINRDGAVDVIDALLLADRVRSGEAKSRRWDLNSDGKVDARDSEEILARVVDLERSGS